ncbi:MAG: tetratricopeptide repeat protein [Bryobacteraceae bacterium]
MTRVLLAFALCFAQQQKSSQPQKQEQKQEQQPAEPPEEDKQGQEKEYAFNPLQAAKEINVGNFYFKKGSFKAAALRFEEASKWDPTNSEAFLRLGDAYEKMGDQKRMRAAWEKFLEAAPDHKRANEIRRKIGKGKPAAHVQTPLGSPVHL